MCLSRMTTPGADLANDYDGAGDSAGSCSGNYVRDAFFALARGVAPVPGCVGNVMT